MEIIKKEYDNRMGIYIIRNVETGHSYIGSSNRLRIRQRKHISDLKRGNHHSVIMQRAWEKYGLDGFEFLIIEEVIDRGTLIEREQFYIDSLKPEYNINPRAESSIGRVVTEETREKLRISHLGEKHSDERRRTKSLAQGGNNHWTKKKSFSEDSKKKMSDAHKSLYKNGYKSPRIGLKMPEHAVEASRQRNYKPIDQLTVNGEFIKTWRGATVASEELGISSVGITSVCRGRRFCKTAGGFKWRYSLTHIEGNDILPDGEI